MAALSSGKRAEIRAAWASEVSSRRELFPLTRPELDAAIAAVDGWIDANAAAFNSALPVAARNGLTAAQKAELLALVALKRFAG